MARIEDYIANHRDDFDDLEPSAEHFKSFEQKLRFINAAQNKPAKHSFPYAQVLAALVLVVASAMLVNQLYFKNTQQYGKEIKVIRSSYHEILKNRYKQFNIATDGLPASIRHDYEKQIEKMKQQTKELEQTLNLTQDNPAVRQVLMQHYKKTDRTLIRMTINAERNQIYNNQNQR